MPPPDQSDAALAGSPLHVFTQLWPQWYRIWQHMSVPDKQAGSWAEQSCTSAAESGDLDTLQWLRRQVPPRPRSRMSCKAAAKFGHLTVLQWLRSQDPPCPWCEEPCTAAAGCGHLHILLWLRSQDPPCPWSERTCQAASRAGHLQTAKKPTTILSVVSEELQSSS